MKSKYIFLLLALLLTSIFITACSEIQGLPTVVELEDSMKEIISSKGDSYDFLNDEQYIAKMNELVHLVVENNFIKEEHFQIGNLNDDNIPELVVFRERDPKNVDDQGALEVYGFISGKYSLLSQVPMNYDNTNYELVIGKIGPNQNGILLNNQAGSQSGVTYGFILDDGNLVNVLNSNIINLVSINTENEIKDIDKDGVLEFSIITIDPESTDDSMKNSHKIKYWYRWNGSDGADFIKYEKVKDDNSKNVKTSENDVLEEAKKLLSSDRQNFIAYLKLNKKFLSSVDNTTLLSEYLNTMMVEAKAKEVIVNSLFSKYQLGNSSDYLFSKYGLSLERLNDAAYLNREKTLNQEIELKEHLLNNLNLGYKLSAKDGKYIYDLNYQAFLDEFGDNILREYRDFYSILALNSNSQYQNNGTLMIPLDKLAERIIIIDNFKVTYPYSEFIAKLNPIYNNYLNTFLFGSTNSPVFDKESGLIDQDILSQYKDIKEKYPETNLGDIVSSFINELQNNGNKISRAIKDKFSNY
ncbi:MAG: hypothetical protein GX053_02265 [Tissierella sp.]|nr:hypothetical protein [Tissierella sp.]